MTRQAESNVGTARCYLCLFSNATTQLEHKSEGNSPINYHLHVHLVLVTTWYGIGDNFMALFMTAESFLMAPESSLTQILHMKSSDSQGTLDGMFSHDPK